MSMGKDVLRCEDLCISFGGLKAVSKFNLELNPGELCALIGPNGAGKTTIFNLLTGVYRPTSGSFTLGSKNLVGLAPHEIAKSGVARTFQNIRLFKELSVLDNILVSYHMEKPYGYLALLLRTKGFYTKEEELREKAASLLKIFDLEDRAHEYAGNLNYGDQRRLEIVRALATSPQVLLLDEPAAGMNSKEKVDLMQIIYEIRKSFNVTIFLIEHDMKLVMGISERILVLDHGELIAEGSPEVIQKNPKVIEAYLGVQ